MTKQEFLDFARDLFDDMHALLEAKNSDYTAGGDAFANFESSEDWGVDALRGLMCRYGDKHQRLKSFFQSGELKVKSESVEDAMKDVIGYMVLALAMRKAASKNG